jgi:transcriptional regulator with XRE-family HTH domain
MGDRSEPNIRRDTPDVIRRDAPGLIRRVRRELDLSQRDLADLIDRSKGALSRMETGETAPSLELLDRLLRMAGLRYVLGDPEGGEAVPMRSDAVRDRGYRRLPAHLDPAPYRDIDDPWRYSWQGWERQAAKVGYEHRELRDQRRARFGRQPADHPDPSVLRRPKPVPRPPRNPPPECCCPMQCERWCVRECPCQCEPIGLWGYARYEDLPGNPPGDPPAGTPADPAA